MSSEQAEDADFDVSDRRPTGPFATAAPTLVRLGLVPIPCGGTDGKRPLLRSWQTLTPTQVARDLADLIERFGDANVGLACGASGLAVVDIDNPDLIETMVARYGETPIIIQTPSGGFHLYYRMANATVRGRNLRADEGLAVDIKAAGGLVIAPPSINPNTGRPYQFLSGDWHAIKVAPIFPSNQLAEATTSSGKDAPAAVTHGNRIPQGQRNDWLFHSLLREAPACDDMGALLDVARTRNEFAFEAPLPDPEVIDVVKRVWGYEIEGRNWVGQAPRTILTRNDLTIFARDKNGGNALMLWTHLIGEHAKRKSAFALDTAAMARADVLPGWTRWRYRRAIKTLRDLELLELVEIGQRRTNKTFAPNLYFLRRPGRDLA